MPANRTRKKAFALTKRMIPRGTRAEDYSELYDRWLKANTAAAATYKYVEAVRCENRVLSFRAVDTGYLNKIVAVHGLSYREADIPCPRKCRAMLSEVFTQPDHPAIFRLTCRIWQVWSAKLTKLIGPSDSVFPAYVGLCWLFGVQAEFSEEDLMRHLDALRRLSAARP